MWQNFSFVLIIAQVISGVKISGPCPTVAPSTHYPFNLQVNSHYYVVYIAPFTDTESNVFQKIPNDYLIMFNGCDKIITTFMGNSFYLGPSGVSANSTKIPNSDEIQLPSKLVPQYTTYDYFSELTCAKPVNESVTVWLADKDFIILWSCHEMQVDQKLFHDAALVYGIEEKSYPLNITLFEKMVRKFKYLAKLY